MKRTRYPNKGLIPGYVGQSLDFSTVPTDNGDAYVGNVSGHSLRKDFLSIEG